MGRFFEDFRALRAHAAAPVFRAIDADCNAAPSRLQPVLRYVRDNLFSPELNVDRIRRACNLRDNGISTVFGAAIGETPRRYIEGRRIDVSRRLLRDTTLRIAAIAQILGFADSSTFGAAFKRRTGCTASVYRKAETQVAGPDAVVPDALMLAAVTSDAERFAPVNPQKIEISDARVAQIQAKAIWSVLRHHRGDQARRLVNSVRPTSPALFELLLEKTRSAGRGDRRRGVEIAEMALAILPPLHGLASAARSSVVQHVRGWAALGNAQRLALDFGAAEAAFDRADALRALIFDAPTAGAEVDHLRAALRRSQTRYDEALVLEDRALAVFREAPESGWLVRALTARALLLALAGRPTEGLSNLEEAVERTEQGHDRYLAFTARFNFASALVEAGDFTKGTELLAAIRTRFADHLGTNEQAMLTALEGRLAQGLGDLPTAEQCVRVARRMFAEQHELFNWAAASMDLAIIFRQRDKTDDVLALLRQTIPVIEALGAHRETVLALGLLGESVRDRARTLSLLRELRVGLATR